MIGLLLTWIAGFEGMPIPYSPKLDDGITILLLCCFFISAYVLSRSRKFLVQLVKMKSFKSIQFLSNLPANNS